MYWKSRRRHCRSLGSNFVHRLTSVRVAPRIQGSVRFVKCLDRFVALYFSSRATLTHCFVLFSCLWHTFFNFSKLERYNWVAPTRLDNSILMHKVMDLVVHFLCVLHLLVWRKGQLIARNNLLSRDPFNFVKSLDCCFTHRLVLI